MNKKQLTVAESACIITGYGIGGGVMAMPYLAQKRSCGEPAHIGGGLRSQLCPSCDDSRACGKKRRRFPDY